MGLADGEAWEKDYGMYHGAKHTSKLENLERALKEWLAEVNPPPHGKFESEQLWRAAHAYFGNTPAQTVPTPRGMPAQQPWVSNLTIMMQSVIFASVRAPDGIRKDHPVKVLLRWYRRCVLMSAFDKKAFDNPFSEGGGSFTGPFTAEHVHNCVAVDTWAEVRAWWSGANDATRWNTFSRMRDVYLRHVDEFPHHFQLHFMHAAQIVGYYHPDQAIAAWWLKFYRMIVNDAHLFAESKELMDLRLSDNPDEWRKREEVVAL